jgi:hypothetical protein
MVDVPVPQIQIGPLVEAELRRRVYELEGCCYRDLTQHDRQGIAALTAALKELLRPRR